jgi:potassium-transporting ATPase KdpC subunit
LVWREELSVIKELRPALVIFAMLAIATGLAYPAVVTLVAKVFFADQAGGSIIERGGHAIGSRLLGQAFTSPKYFWSRPSATGPQPNNGAASTGSNQATTNPILEAAARERIAALRAADPGNERPVPVDLVTASASGLDPHISPAAAEYQVSRVARTRGVDEAAVRRLVDAATEGRTFGLLGEPRVNVLELNLALDAQSAQVK